jgi:HTH-type transcriptional regulator/antitoxin HigA
LLLEYLPKPIKSEQEYQHAVAQLETLLTPRPGAARSQLIELLSTLIEQYESRQHPTPNVPPGEMLAHLLEARGIKAAELGRQTGIPPATISNVVSGRRGISKNNAVALAKFFGVSPAVFVTETGDGAPPFA